MSKQPKIRSVTYAMLRKTGMYENDRAECVVEVADYESGAEGRRALGEAVQTAKRACADALGVPLVPTWPGSDEHIVERAALLGLSVSPPYGATRFYRLTKRDGSLHCLDRAAVLAYLDGAEGK